MKASFYKNLQNNFITIYSSQPPNTNDQEKYVTAISSIKEARRKINMYSAPDEKKILLYCIDTLFEILNEGDEKKLFAYTGVIRNIPEIYMQKRNLYSFRQEIRAFQRKYGKHYFTFIDEIKPHFTKKAPQNKWEYFSPSADVDFKLLHPMGYKIFCLMGVAALMLPQILYMAYCLFINPAPNEWPQILGVIGTFIMGVGLFNIVAAWIHQYLGHLLTAVCLLGGAALTALSLYLLY